MILTVQPLPRGRHSVTPPLSSEGHPHSVLKEALAYGVNHYSATSDKTIHAEENAITRLKPRPTTKALKSVNIIVIRTTKNGVLGSSKPCVHCTSKLSEMLPKRGYRVNWVYYSTAGGGIERCKLPHLVNSPEGHVSGYYRWRPEKVLKKC